MQHRHGEFDTKAKPTTTFQNILCRVWYLLFANDGQQHPVLRSLFGEHAGNLLSGTSGFIVKCGAEPSALMRHN